MADKDKRSGVNRRDFLKAASTVPVLGAFGLTLNAKKKKDTLAREEILSIGSESAGANPNVLKRNYKRQSGANDTLNLAIVGCGGRGKSILRSAGFHPPGEDAARGLDGTENLNIKLVAVCDLFTPSVEWAEAASGGTAKVYKTYQ